MMKIPFLTTLVFIFLFSCGNIKIQKPDGFAEIKTGNVYKAISPEGLPFQVRWFKNYPEKDLEFWQRALKSHLLEEGYQFVTGKTLGDGPFAIQCFEWGAPYGGADYIYLTALAVKGDKILLAEAAGELKLYKEYQTSLMNSLQTVNIP